MTKRNIHICYEIAPSGELAGLGSHAAEQLFQTASAMQVVQMLVRYDESPCQTVIDDYMKQNGMTPRTPDALMAQITQWLRLIARYLKREVLIVPHDTAAVWGDSVETEEEFILVTRGVFATAGDVILTYEAKYPPRVAVQIMDQLDRSGQRSEPKDRRQSSVSEADIALLRSHFAAGYDRDDIADHLNLDRGFVSSEHSKWWEALESEINAGVLGGGAS